MNGKHCKHVSVVPDSSNVTLSLYPHHVHPGKGGGREVKRE